MAHPLKSETEASHEAKLRSMTTHYGGADPAAVQFPNVEKYKIEGPEEDVGFGADGDKPKLHGARKVRMTRPANPFATYKRGGRVKGSLNRDTSSTSAAVGSGGGTPSRKGLGTVVYPGAVKMGQQDTMRTKLEPSPTPIDNRARGGRTGGRKKKGGTHVNIMIAPQHGQPGAAGAPPISAMPTPPPAPRPPMPMPPPGGPMGGPPVPPPGMPPGGAAAPPGARPAGLPIPGGAGVVPVPPGAVPPGVVPPGAMPAIRPPFPPRKRGGRVMAKKHDDEREDAAMIKGMVRKSALKPHGSMRAAGGRVGLTGGAQSGEGRLERNEHWARHGRSRPQEV